MKKTLLVLVLLMIICINVNAQIWGVGGTNTFTPDKVAIGSLFPLAGDAALHVYGEEISTPCPSSGSTYHNPRPVLWLEQPTCYSCGVCPALPSANIFQITKNTYGPMGMGNIAIDVINNEGFLGILTATPTFPLDVNGFARINGNATINGTATISGYANIGGGATVGSSLYVGDYAVIGHGLTGGYPAVPVGYSLYVGKGILAEKVKVALASDPANWSDFVFNKDYKLMPLGEVESYVNANKHLPEIPSATEVFKDGIDVAVMDAKLLQKIEELTLYAIQQQKQIDQLQKEIKSIKKAN